jgi:hypothetical protein
MTTSRARAFLFAAVAVAAALWSRPAAAANVQLGVGADYWFDPEVGAFELTLAIDTPIAKKVTLGGRFGLLLTSGPNDVAVPIDLRLRIRADRFYFEGLVGPYIFFTDEWLRAHAALGFGIVTGSLSFGIEAGYLHPSAIAGVRLAFRL